MVLNGCISSGSIKGQLRTLNFFFAFWFSFAISLNAAQLANPWEQFSKISEGNYFDPTLSLRAQEAEYLASPFHDNYLQAFATLLSYVGRYDDGQKYFDTMASVGNQLPVPEDLSAFKAQSAISSILSLGKKRQVIMMNEAHHVPETRVLTYALLKPLYEMGFRYLAMETFDLDGVAKSETKGFPIRGIGFFSSEPVMADVAREAMKIGYHLIAYEHTPPCDHEHHPTECQDERERGQARNLVERILKKEPKAKILVHAGYGHIDKTGGSSSFPWIPMAKYFKDFSGIDPLSIDQVEFRSRSNVKSEERSYRRLLAHFNITHPTILSSSKENYWTALPGHYDLQVILPDSPRNNSIPLWALSLLKRRMVCSHWERCSSFPCLVQAVSKKEEQADFIPVDQVFSESKNTSLTLSLPPGKYSIRYISKGNVSVFPGDF